MDAEGSDVPLEVVRGRRDQCRALEGDLRHFAPQASHKSARKRRVVFRDNDGQVMGSRQDQGREARVENVGMDEIGLEAASFELLPCPTKSPDAKRKACPVITEVVVANAQNADSVLNLVIDRSSARRPSGLRGYDRKVDVSA